MKATLVSGAPTQAATDAGRSALTPELTATVGARYSRDDLGLEGILAKIDFADPDAAVDRIFNMLDYGHQSVADMATVTIFIDRVSLYAAHHLWMQCPTASGQESSTRYIRLHEDGLIPAEELGVPEERRAEWDAQNARAFLEYDRALEDWDGLLQRRPEASRIPAGLREEAVESKRKARELGRMERNYAFDRARYYLPVAAATNLMLVMSARSWVGLIQHLLSHPLPELNAIGEACREELALATPRLIRHAAAGVAHRLLIADEFADLVELADGPMGAREEGSLVSAAPTAALSVRKPVDVHTSELDYVRALSRRVNRYSPAGRAWRRTTVVYAWAAVALAEIRDMARHRPGEKDLLLVPQGFYGAEDEVPLGEVDLMESRGAAAEFGGECVVRQLDALLASEPTHVYWSLLGTQYPFEHTNQGHHYVYESELRTGVGAHYRYARHYKDSLALLYARVPEARGLVLEGDWEPE